MNQEVPSWIEGQVISPRRAVRPRLWAAQGVLLCERVVGMYGDTQWACLRLAIPAHVRVRVVVRQIMLHAWQDVRTHLFCKH